MVESDEVFKMAHMYIRPELDALTVLRPCICCGLVHSELKISLE